MERLLRMDPLRLRRLIPQRARQRIYDSRLTRERAGDDQRAAAITPEDFRLGEPPLDEPSTWSRSAGDRAPSVSRDG